MGTQHGWRQLDDRAITRWRMHAQRLAGKRHASVPDVVRSLLGVQAENHGQAAWAVATRTVKPDRAAFDRAFDEGAILRTHVLRPTWHFVAPADIRWLIELTAPRVRRSFQQLQGSLGVSDRELERARDLLADWLAGGRQLTRASLRGRLRDAGLRVDGQHLSLLLDDAELAGLVCSGAMKDGEHTYALIDDRAPDARRLERDEALAELVRRHIRGHGPATERDLGTWATLTLTDVRRGLAEVGNELESFALDGRRYWFADPPPPGNAIEPAGHLLQILDEMYRGFAESRGHIDRDRLVVPGREASTGMALVDGSIVGGMRRTVRRGSVTFEVLPFRALSGAEVGALTEAGRRYGRFVGLDPVVTLADPAG